MCKNLGHSVTALQTFDQNPSLHECLADPSTSGGWCFLESQTLTALQWFCDCLWYTLLRVLAARMEVSFLEQQKSRHPQFGSQAGQTQFPVQIHHITVTEDMSLHLVGIGLLVELLCRSWETWTVKYQEMTSGNAMVWL